MKFTIMARELADAVGWVSHALPKRPVVPVLAGILLEADDDGVTLAAFDYDTSRRVVVELDAPIDPGKVLVPGRLLADIVKVFPKNELVDVAADDREIQLRCGQAVYVLTLFDVDDYPTLPKTPDPVGSIDAAELADAVARVSVAAGRDDTLPQLTGIRFEIGDGGCIDMAATDRYRVAWSTLSWSATLDDKPGVEALIPAKTLADIVKGFRDGPVQLHLGDGTACFAGGNRTTSVRLLDPQFIKFRALFDIEAARTVTFDAADLVKAIRRVGLLAERSMAIRLTFQQEEMLVEVGGESGRACETLPCSLDGDVFTIAFTPAFLTDGLAAVGGTATMHVQASATKAVVITGTGNPALKYVVIPVRLSA